jgi:hypothetical protein
VVGVLRGSSVESFGSISFLADVVSMGTCEWVIAARSSRNFLALAVADLILGLTDFGNLRGSSSMNS